MRDRSVGLPHGPAEITFCGFLIVVATSCTSPTPDPAPPSFAIPAQPTSTTAPSLSGPAVVVDCGREFVERPSDIVLTCGDGAEQLLDLTWTTWNAEKAEGRGTEGIVECRPSCAAGKLVQAPVTVVLTDSRPIPQRSERWFARAIISGGPSGQRVVELPAP